MTGPDKRLIDPESAKQEGHAWIVPVPAEFGPGDSPDDASASSLILLEDGVEVGPARAQHETIRRFGGGAYSHWGEWLYFSSSDGSDPRKNGKSYQIMLGANGAERFPLEVYIETINGCNARCPFCPLFHGPSPLDRKSRPAKIMSWEMFEKVAREIASWPRSPATIYPHANGEPLQDPQFPRRLALLAELGLARLINLHSNAQFLSEDMARNILQAGVRSISIGFDGATKQVYEAHRVRCDYDRVLANIDGFVRLRKEMNAQTQIAIVFVRTRDNEHEVRDAYQMFARRLDPKLDEFHDKLASDWSDEKGKSDFFRLPKDLGKRVDRCAALENQLVISSDGSIAACCIDYNLTVSNGGFGNAANGTLLDHWRGAKRAKLREALKNGPLEAIPEKCRECPIVFGEQQIDLKQSKVGVDSTTVGSFELGYRFETA